jgi:hypothetical protein
MACACVDCFFRALEVQSRYGLHPEPAAANTNKIQPADSSDTRPVPEVSEVASGVECASSPGWGERSRETGMARSDARESQTARTPSPYCKDPVSAPARAAAGGNEGE